MGLCVAHIIQKVQVWFSTAFSKVGCAYKMPEEFHYIVVEVVQAGDAGDTSNVHREFIQIKVVKRQPNVEAQIYQGMML